MFRPRLGRTSSSQLDFAPVFAVGRGFSDLVVVLSFCGFLLVTCLAHANAAEPSSEQLRFFENEIRPLLSQHCYACHSAGAKKLQASLHLDSRAAMLRGGDSGPAIVPGKPAESLLLEAVRYESFEMPPKGKLVAKDVAALEKWVAMGAPWPREPEPSAEMVREEFDWKQRVQEHWCWQPIAAVTPPEVHHQQWPLHAIDRFILARLEASHLVPAADADKRTWLRRVYFDLIGLPPTPEDVHAFLADDTAKAYEHVVDALLRSPHFGEKWTRHWLDLVRYAETLGHEFDYPLHHAHRYRDYVIRALNADVPYDRFVHEHVAGDLLESPRRHPRKGFNESIIGTGFWYLGEACHAPTDVKADEADRIDNQIDVFSKTFLGLTVACARCHDHKFDPIPTADYYALAGYIQSSRRQEALLDPFRKIRQARDELVRLDQERQQLWLRLLPSLPLDAKTVRQSLVELTTTEEDQSLQALQGPTHPFHLLGQLRLPENFASKRDQVQRSLQAATQQAIAATEATQLFVDFRDADLRAWYFTGHAFDPQPTRPGTLQAVRGKRFAQPGAIHSGRFGGKLQGVLRSPTFVLQHKQVHYKVNGRGAEIRLIVDGYTMDEFNALLFAGMQQEVNTQGQARWISQTRDVYHYVGHRAHIEVIDHGDGFAALEQIRFSDEGAPQDAPHPLNLQVLAAAPQDPGQLIDQYVTALQQVWQRFQNQEMQQGDTEVINWLLEVGATSIPAEVLALETQMAEHDAATPDPLPVIALTDGDAENEHIFIRGSHKNLGPVAPRRLLVALAGEDQPSPSGGSGRLQLAQRLTDPSNPLTARVIVNRLWHHLFGRGIVPTVDDFGEMGQLPSHPELLDWLAYDFMHEQHWSVKKAIRQLVLSRTYRMSSRSRSDPERVRLVDPDNILLHRAPIRRLTAEAIRDSLLMLSGELDLTMYGPSVPVHLTSFMEGRGRPKQNGPRDGRGRRSLYIEVRRNFLSPMMLAFDRPSPFSSMGRRSVSNVPAQSLILMNDPFVTDQTQLWAKRLAELEPNSDARVRLAFEMAFAQPPTSVQFQRSREFLDESPQPDQAWNDLCHMLVNMKPFIFLP